MKRSSELRRTQGLNRYAGLKPTSSLAVARAPKPRSNGFATSHVQRKKVAQDPVCIACHRDRYETTVDPHHLVSRSLGGCTAALCVVPLCRRCHDSFHAGELDLTRHLTGQYVEEVQHALGHCDGSLTRLLHLLSGKRWEPVEERAA